MGTWTRLLKTIFPNIHIISWDTDPTCVKVLKSLKVEAVLGDSLSDEFISTIKKSDDVLMDWDRFTILGLDKYEKFFTELFIKHPLWVVVNDCAKSKLHLNYKSYGLKDYKLESYVKQYSVRLRKHGYKVSKFEGHGRATQLLLERA